MHMHIKKGIGLREFSVVESYTNSRSSFLFGVTHLDMAWTYADVAHGAGRHDARGICA